MLLSKSRSLAGFGIAFAVTVITSTFQVSAAGTGQDNSTNAPFLRALENKASLQSMERDACFKMAGIKNKDFGARVRNAIETFDLSMDQHKAGAPLIRPGQSKSNFADLEGNWTTLSAAFQQVAAGDYHYIPIRQVLTLAPKLYEQLEDIQPPMQDSKRSEQTADEARLMISLEQKVRVQKLLKEACYVLRGISVKENLAALSVTQDAFLKAHKLAVSSASSGKERMSLNALQSTWSEFLELLAYLKSQGEVEDSAKTQLSVLGDDLTKHLEHWGQNSGEGPGKAVGFGEFYAQSQKEMLN